MISEPEVSKFLKENTQGWTSVQVNEVCYAFWLSLMNATDEVREALSVGDNTWMTWWREAKEIAGVTGGTLH